MWTRRCRGVAREFLGKDDRLRLVLQDGAEFLLQQQRSSFDLVFADAVPGKYEVLDLASAVVQRGGFYVIDDMLPQMRWPEGHAAKVPALVDDLTNRPSFRSVSLAWASGVVLLVRVR